MGKLGLLEEELFDSKKDIYGDTKLDTYATREEYYQAKSSTLKNATISSTSFDYITFTEKDENPLGKGDWQDRWFVQIITYKASGSDYVRLMAYNRGDTDEVYTCGRDSTGNWSDWCELSRSTYTHYIAARAYGNNRRIFALQIVNTQKEPFTNTQLNKYIEDNFAMTLSDGVLCKFLPATGTGQTSMIIGLIFSISNNSITTITTQASGSFSSTPIGTVEVLKDNVIKN